MPEYGICSLSFIAVRKEPSYRSEMVTQLVFGDEYEILGYEKRWAKIRITFDGYEGFIAINQLHKVSENYYEAYRIQPRTYSSELIAHLKSTYESTSVLLGSILPFYNNGHVRIGHKVLNIDVKPIRFSKVDIIPLAMKFMNAPYLWGGKTPMGVDCSGFVQQVYKMCGINLQRDAYQQAEQGFEVAPDNYMPGDLCFFRGPEEERVTHVGIMIKNFAVLHASGQVKINSLDSTGIFDVSRGDYSHILTSIRRVIPSD